MKNAAVLFLLFLTFNLSSSFSQGIIAGQVGPGMTYYDFPDDSVFAIASHGSATINTIFIDFNNNGMNDILIAGKGQSSQGGHYEEIEIEILNFNQTARISVQNGGAIPYQLSDTIIGSQWARNVSLYYYYSDPFSWTSFNLWGGLGDRYIGFYLYYNNQPYRGWIRGKKINYDGFILKDMAIQTLPLGVGLEESIDHSLKIYPNPFSDYLTIEGFGNTTQEVEIIDITGKIILEKDIKENKIDLTQLTSGIYFLRISNGDSFEIKKIIKQ